MGRNKQIEGQYSGPSVKQCQRCYMPLTSQSCNCTDRLPATKPKAKTNEKNPKLDDLLAGSRLAMLQSAKYIEPSEVSRVGKRRLKQARKVEREKTKGPGWFNMGAPELTAERKNDMEALRLRGALETKRFYKRNNITSLPKYFQVGRVVETPADYYSSRIPKKQRKQTLAEELVAEVQ